MTKKWPSNAIRISPKNLILIMIKTRLKFIFSNQKKLWRSMQTLRPINTTNYKLKTTISWNKSGQLTNKILMLLMAIKTEEVTTIESKEGLIRIEPDKINSM